MSEQELVREERKTAHNEQILKCTLVLAVFILGVCIVELAKTFI